MCIVHLVRAALRYATDTDSREVAADLKAIYQSATVEEAEGALESFMVYEPYPVEIGRRA